MTRLSIGHVGLHVRNLEEEIAFLETIGAEVTAFDRAPAGRLAFVSLDGDRHHSFALFEDGETVPSGDSRKEPRGIHHIALPAASRAEVDAWRAKLEAKGVAIDGPHVQGPEDGGFEHGSGSYAIFFTDPNGICFEIYTGAMTVAELRDVEAEAAERKMTPAEFRKTWTRAAKDKEHA